jgi:hypothetical protein
VKGSSSLSFCRLPISLWFTSYLLLCPRLTDAPYSGYGASPPLPFPKWRLHSQGPHTLPFQGARHSPSRAQDIYSIQTQTLKSVNSRDPFQQAEDLNSGSLGISEKSHINKLRKSIGFVFRALKLQYPNNHASTGGANP